MFTGIIEATGKIKDILEEGTNRLFVIESPISHALHEDQSVSHDGVCLTVTAVKSHTHSVTAIKETLHKSNLGRWGTGKEVNLERCMKADGRFDGHIVQGHVDGVAKVADIRVEDGSWLFTFEVSDAHLLVEKGSVCINGTSLTCFAVTNESFCVAIIPYTYEHTTFSKLHIRDTVNLEFDIVGKYVEKLLKR